LTLLKVILIQNPVLLQNFALARFLPSKVQHSAIMSGFSEDRKIPSILIHLIEKKNYKAK